jgi:hypothetical protein
MHAQLNCGEMHAPLNCGEMHVLRKNTLDFTKRARYEHSKRCELLRKIRTAQNTMNEALELELLRQLAKLENDNANT